LARVSSRLPVWQHRRYFLGGLADIHLQRLADIGFVNPGGHLPLTQSKVDLSQNSRDHGDTFDRLNQIFWA